MSTRGLSGGGTITSAITFAKMGVKWKPLNHNGQSEAVLAVLRGDADILWITILEDAIKKAVEDPGFQETAKKMRKTTDYLNGRDTEKLMNNVMQSYQNYSPIVRELFGQDKK